MFELPLLVLFALSGAVRQSRPAVPADTGYLYVTHQHLRWPSPQSLIADSHSKDDQARWEALLLFGFAAQEAPVKVYSQPSAVREAVVTPDRVELK